MAKDLANIEKTARALDDANWEIEKWTRIKEQLELHREHLEKTK